MTTSLPLAVLDIDSLKSLHDGISFEHSKLVSHSFELGLAFGFLECKLVTICIGDNDTCQYTTHWMCTREHMSRLVLQRSLDFQLVIIGFCFHTRLEASLDLGQAKVSRICTHEGMVVQVTFRNRTYRTAV